MKKILYFVVEKKLNEIDGVGTTNGLTDINVYEMVNNRPEGFVMLRVTNDKSSRDAINNYLKDHGYGDDEFKLIQL